MAIIPEVKLIEFAKLYLKEKGFKKKNKWWTKDTGEFTLSFYIQGSWYNKEDYDIRPGVFINKLGVERSGLFYYGHFYIGIRNDLQIEEIFETFEQFCLEWTDKRLIKERAKLYKAWDERNPLEKRRAKLADLEKDPNPVPVLSVLGASYMDWLINKL